MWTIPIAVMLFLGLLIFVARSVSTSNQRHKHGHYRKEYQQLIYQADALSRAFNDLAARISARPEAFVLDRYEAALRVFETLLDAMAKITPFGSDNASLRSAAFLVRDCKKRLDGIFIASTHLNKSTRSFSSTAGISIPKIQNLSGCYFCSKPVATEPKPLIEVRVRVDGELKSVEACPLCEDQLRRTKKVKVLFFVKEGKAYHWSEVVEYKPSSDYWHLNRAQPLSKLPRKLELVYSRRDTDSGGPI